MRLCVVLKMMKVTEIRHRKQSLGRRWGQTRRRSDDGFRAWWARFGVSGSEYDKGIRRMPWHQEAMKDVARCEKPWGAASRL